MALIIVGRGSLVGAYDERLRDQGLPKLTQSLQMCRYADDAARAVLAVRVCVCAVRCGAKGEVYWKTTRSSAVVVIW